MKILWLTNFPLPMYSEYYNEEGTVNEGWLAVLASKLSSIHSLSVCFMEQKKRQKNCITHNRIDYYSILNNFPDKYDEKLIEELKQIIIKSKPDIIHIMGTEFPHCYSMISACKEMGIEEKCVISIQGIISRISKFYDLGVEKLGVKNNIRDLLIKDSVYFCKQGFEIRGKYEIEAIKNAKNIIGRTEWDYNMIKLINPNIEYYKCNETLRGEFYKRKWKYNQCEKESIFISQATYPIKGFHFILEACSLLKGKYPKLKIYVASHTNFVRGKKRIKIFNDNYTNYICKQIEEKNLANNIVFMGKLQEKEIIDAYLKANVFISASTIENSSNSLGEAMLLGMPIVASFNGGTPSMITHNEEGVLYATHDVYMLAKSIDQLFSLEEKVQTMCENARKRAKNTHCIEVNFKRQCEIYELIVGKVYDIKENEV